MDNIVARYYSQIAKKYHHFYSNDLYSQRENLAIANWITTTIGKPRDGDYIVDLGCGRGPPREIYQNFPQTTYHGWDISPNMITLANEIYRKEIENQQMQFQVGDLANIVQQLPEKSYDLCLSLHGVFSYLCPAVVPTCLKQINKITKKYAIISIFSQYAANRAAEYPKTFLHQDRQLKNHSSLKTTAYNTDEIKTLFANSGFEIIALQGLNILGGMPTIHTDFIQQQQIIETMQYRPDKLIHKIDTLIANDFKIGSIFPDLGHDFIVIAKPKKTQDSI